MLQSSSESILIDAGNLDNQFDRWPFKGFYWCVIGLNICFNLQVLTVGLAYFYQAEWWQAHVWLVRFYAVLAIVLPLWSHRIELSPRIRQLTISLPILLTIQFLSIHISAPIPLGIIHPLVGFTLFSISTTLVHRTKEFLMLFNQSPESFPDRPTGQS
jgi:hypothetical protein